MVPVNAQRHKKTTSLKGNASRIVLCIVLGVGPGSHVASSRLQVGTAAIIQNAAVAICRRWPHPSHDIRRGRAPTEQPSPS